MRIAVFGTYGSPLTTRIAKALRDRGLPIHALVLDSKVETPRDVEIWEERTAGRLPPLPLHLLGGRVPCHFVESHNDDETFGLVRDEGIDLIVAAGTPRILKARILEAPRVGVLNVHPGILPGFRGCTCVEWALYLDEPVGNSAHFMAEGIDAGPVVATEPTPVLPGDAYVDVRTRVYERGFELMARAVETVRDRGLHPARMPPQPEGRYFKPIGQDEMREAVARLESGRYAHAGRPVGAEAG
jgi:methionyl-tRNA formyltransferase